MHRTTLLLAPALLVCLPGAAQVFEENFNFGSLDPNLEMSLQPGMLCSVTSGTNGMLRFEFKGTQFAQGTILTDFTATGDFQASVAAHNGDGAALWRLGLRVISMDASSAVYFNGASEIAAEVNTPVNVTTNNRAPVPTNTTVVLELRRAGITVTVGFSDSGGYHQLLSVDHLALGMPIRCQLFAQDYQHNQWGTLDDFKLSAGAFNPQPISRLAASIGRPDASSVEISWPAYEGRSYQVLYSPSLTSAAWTPLIPPTNGTGQVMSCTDPAPGTSNRFYRVVELH